MSAEKNITVIRSARKTVGLEIKSDGRIIVRAPFRMSDADIQGFIDEKRTWLDKHLSALADNNAAPVLPKFTAAEIHALADRALIAIPPRVKYYADILGVTYGRITIRNQTTRWGSCSSKGNLNFNCLLMLMPQEIADYTIVHELCHRKEMNHSAAFWTLVGSVMPDYKARILWMKQHGGEIMRRIK